MDEIRIKSYLQTLDFRKLLSAAVLDPHVGLRRVRLPDAPIDLGLGIRALYLAELAPGARVGPHFHTTADELYLMLDGEGLMHLGWPHKEGERFICDWSKGRQVPLKGGDTFCVRLGEVHSLANSSSRESLILAFVCLPENLDDKIGRRLVSNLP